MALQSYQLALAAAAQRASVAYGGKSATQATDPVKDVPCRQILLQATGADAYVGGDSTVTSTNYGTKVSSTDLQPTTFGPFETGPIKLSDFWVAGAGATLRITLIPY